MIETSFEYPKDIGVLNYDYVEMDDSSENDCLLNNTNKNPYGIIFGFGDPDAGQAMIFKKK